MEFEENDSSGSGSPVESESPPPVPLGVGGGGGGGGGGEVLPQVMNMAVNMSLERSLGVPVAGSGLNHGNGGGSGVTSGGEAGGIVTAEKKKRGRPRKYDSNGNLSAAYKISAAARAGGTDAAAAAAASPHGFTLTSPPSSQFSSAGKRGRGSGSGSGSGRVRGTGRGLDSGNWQHLSPLGEVLVNTAGEDFTPHIVTVYTGEDVAGKILSFAQKGTRGVCVLSANGSVSNATIRQPASSGGILTYEGRFEILTLTGSYTVSDNGGMKSRTGGLSVSLAGPDGRVIGGGVAGMLMAASPIQIVVGSFMTNSDKVQQRKETPEPRMTPVPLSAPSHHMSMPRTVPLSSPEGNMFPAPASQLHAQNRGETVNIRSHNPSSLSTENAHWNGPERSADQWPTPDINLSAPMEHQ